MIQLNTALQEQIVAAIRAGAFPHVAAQAFGVSRHSFELWRRRGRSNESDEPFRSFARAVDAAVAQARLRAEMEIFSDQPRIWLQHGPGRETTTSPGWTVAVKPAVRKAGERNPLLMPAVVGLFQRVLAALVDFPEARVRVAGIVGEP